MELAFGIILLVAAVFLVVAVLMQHGKSYGLSGTISGGAETFFGKGKAQTLDKILSKVTTVVAIIFCILVIVLFMVQGKLGGDDKGAGNLTLGGDTSTSESSDATDPTDETDPTDPTDETDPTDPSDSGDATDPTDEAE